MNALEIIRRRNRALMDFDRVAGEVGKTAVAFQQDRIFHGRDVDGNRLKPLARSTRKARGPGHPYGVRPLLDTTRMAQGIVYDRLAPNRVKIGPTARTVGGFPYPVVHHVGTKFIPRRRIVGVSAVERREVETIVRREAIRALESVRF